MDKNKLLKKIREIKDAKRRKVKKMNTETKYNTAQNHLIKILVQWLDASSGCTSPAFKNAINTAPSKETAEAIKRIYKKVKRNLKK